MAKLIRVGALSPRIGLLDDSHYYYLSPHLVIVCDYCFDRTFVKRSVGVKPCIFYLNTNI